MFPAAWQTNFLIKCVCVCVCVWIKIDLWWLKLHVKFSRLQYPDIWWNIILDISVKVLLDDINLKISRLWVKQTTVHNMGGPHPTSVQGLKRKRLRSLRKKEWCLRLPWIQAATSTLLWVSSLPWNQPLQLCSQFLAINQSLSYTYVCVCMYIYIHICIYVCIYIHTHTQYPIGSVSLEKLD